MSDKKLKTIGIKGKTYVPVNERLKYFRETFKGYALETELVAVNAETALIRAVIRNDQGVLVATGTAFERKDSLASMVNKTSHVENCETSAWGRALGNFGIGIDESVASADEVAAAILNQDASAAGASSTPALPKKAVSPPLPASAEQLQLIASLAKDLGKDPIKDVYEPMKITTGLPTAKQAEEIVRILQEKKTKLESEVQLAESK